MIYVTSDLHGYPLESFKELLAKANFSMKRDYCFVLGDVIDRGPDGVKLLQWLMLQPSIQLVRGNHEDILLSCKDMIMKIVGGNTDKLTADDQELCAKWLQNGGMPTLEALKELDEEELEYIFEFIEDAPLYDSVSIDDKEFVLTHSGFAHFDKDKDLEAYPPADLIWNRPSMEDRYFDDITTVFGHTPTVLYGDKYEGRMLVTDTWINIDTGAAMGGAPMLLRLDDMKEFYAED